MVLKMSMYVMFETSYMWLQKGVYAATNVGCTHNGSSNKLFIADYE